MQLVNDTEDTIVLDPGEAITFNSTLHRFENDLYRVTINGRVEVKDLEDLMNTRDFMEKQREMRGGI